MSKYQIVTNCWNDDCLRASFNELTRKVYGFSFEEWYQSGYWSGTYIPHSVVLDGRVVANVSASRMELRYRGQVFHAIQIGTVMTDPDLRGRGYAGLLMEQVVRQYHGEADFLYLMANSSVLDFYPKYGFQRELEHAVLLDTAQLSGKPHAIRRLDTTLPEDRAILLRLAKAAVPMSDILYDQNGYNLRMFYLDFMRKDQLWYIEALDAIAVLEAEGNCMTLVDVVCRQRPPMRELLNTILQASEGTVGEVAFGFTPVLDASFEPRSLPVTELDPEDTFFVRPGRLGRFPFEGDFRFPLLSLA